MIYPSAMDRTPVHFIEGSEELDDYKPRRGSRVRISDTADLRGSDLYEVQVKNVSASGFMAVCPARLEIGSYVTLDVPGIGAVRAQIRWQLGHSMGGMFLDPISLVRCEWTGVKRQGSSDEPDPS